MNCSHVSKLRTNFIVVLALALGACASSPPVKSQAQSTSSPGSAKAQAKKAPAKSLTVVSAADALARGDDAWRRGALDVALYLFVEGLQIEPQNTQLLAKIGSIHERRGNLTLARQAFELAREHDPADARLNERLGLLYLAEGNDAAAEEAFQAAERVEPARWRVSDGRGQLAQRRGAYEEALWFFTRAHELNPQSSPILVRCAEINRLIGRPADAEANLTAALELEDTPQAWRILGKVQAGLKNYDQAFESFLHAGDLAYAYNEVAEAAMEHSDLRVALHYLQSAAQASPTYFEQAHKNLALVNQKLARKETQGGTR